ncbi:MAG: MFS transporter, partial [Thermoprotei archaeon]
MKREAAAFSIGTILGIALVGFGRSIGWALNKGFTFTLLSHYTESAFIKGVILGIEGLIGITLPFIVGWYSDTLTWKIGRRKPFILIGGIFAG